MVSAIGLVCPIVPVTPTDELPHGPGVTDEWLFAAWAPDASLGLLSGHRVTGSRAWYWSAFVQAREPLLHLAEWDVKVRADPFIVKAPEMWAEHHCVAPLEQWSIGNEAFFGCHHVERGRLSSGFELLQQGARALRCPFHLP